MAPQPLFPVPGPGPVSPAPYSCGRGHSTLRGPWLCCSSHHPGPLLGTQSSPILQQSQRAVPGWPHEGPEEQALFTHGHLGPAAWRNAENATVTFYRRRQCPGRWKDSMAAHECGFCLAAGWDAGPASSPESGQRLLAGGQGTECPPSCHWLLPARPPGGAEDHALNMVPRTSPHFIRRVAVLISCAHLSTHSLTCSQALSPLLH